MTPSPICVKCWRHIFANPSSFFRTGTLKKKGPWWITLRKLSGCCNLRKNKTSLLEKYLHLVAVVKTLGRSSGKYLQGAHGKSLYQRLFSPHPSPFIGARIRTPCTWMWMGKMKGKCYAVGARDKVGLSPWHKGTKHSQINKYVKNLKTLDATTKLQNS